MRGFFGLGVAAVVGVILAGCAASGQKAATSAKGNVVEIGVAGPMSGELGAFGEQLRKGAEKAVADINAAGGLNGKTLHLNIGDDQCDRDRARNVAGNLVDAGVVFVAGHFCSGSSIPASKIYGSAGVLQITPSSTNPLLTEDAAERGIKTVLRTAGRDDRQGYTIADWLERNYAGETVAVLDDGGAYGRLVTAVVRKTLVPAHFSDVIYQSFQTKQTDFAPLANELKAASVKAVFVGAYHFDVAAFARAMRAVDPTVSIAAPDALNTLEFWSLAGSAGEGVRFTDAPSRVNDASARMVVASFRADGFEPEGYVLSTYAAVQAFAAAAKATGGFDGAQMAAWLRANPVDTVIGKLDWDDMGDLKSATYAWYVWHGGTYSQEPLH
jgi:branched-chain amino acid transport system substrate-binding protein